MKAVIIQEFVISFHDGEAVKVRSIWAASIGIAQAVLKDRHGEFIIFRDYQVNQVVQAFTE